MQQMRTGQQEEYYQLVGRVFHLDPASYLFGGVDANVDITYNQIVRDYNYPADYMKFDIYNIRNVILRNVERGVYARNQRYVDVLVAVLTSPEYSRKSGLACNEEMILKEAIRQECPFTVANVSDIVATLWDSLADNVWYQQDKQARDRRNAQIAEMSGNGTHGFTVQRGNLRVDYDKDGRKHDPNRGMSQGSTMALKGAWSRDSGLALSEMSNDEVDALYREFKATSDFRSMSREQLREYVKNAGHTNLHGHQGMQLPNRTAAPAPVAQLINPETGQEFDQRSLIRYISNPNDPYAGRRLITDRNTGKSIPALRLRFEEIIKGQA